MPSNSLLNPSKNQKEKQQIKRANCNHHRALRIPGHHRIINNPIALIHSFTHSLIHSFPHSLLYSFTHSLILSFPHSLNHSFSPSLIHSFHHPLLLSKKTPPNIFFVIFKTCNYIHKKISN